MPSLCSRKIKTAYARLCRPRSAQWWQQVWLLQSLLLRDALNKTNWFPSTCIYIVNFCLHFEHKEKMLPNKFPNNLITELHCDGWLQAVFPNWILFFFPPLNPSRCVQFTGLCTRRPRGQPSTQVGFPKLLGPSQHRRAWIASGTVM